MVWARERPAVSADALELKVLTRFAPENCLALSVSELADIDARCSAARTDWPVEPGLAFAGSS